MVMEEEVARGIKKKILKSTNCIFEMSIQEKYHAKFVRSIQLTN